MGNAPPPEELADLLPIFGYDIYVIGTQECQYDDPNGSMKKVIRSPSQKNMYKKCEDSWFNALSKHFEPFTVLLAKISLMEIRIGVFVRKTALRRISNVKTATVACGIGNVIGNKGGVCVAFDFDNCKLCFVNSHLAAHQHKCEARNEDYGNIVEGLSEKLNMGLLNSFHHLFWVGDLNYRCDWPPTTTVFDEKTMSPAENDFHAALELIAAKQLHPLFETDQLVREMKGGRCFVGFCEGDASKFCPTFKVRRKQLQEYNEERLPAWCDRILWYSSLFDRVRLITYDSVPSMTTSDHKPVIAAFAVDLFQVPFDSTSVGSAYISLTGMKVSWSNPALAIEPYMIFSSALMEWPFSTVNIEKSQAFSLIRLPIDRNHPDYIRSSFLSIAFLDGEALEYRGRTRIVLKEFSQGQISAFDVPIFFKGVVCGSFTGRIQIAFQGARTATWVGSFRQQSAPLSDKVLQSKLSLSVYKEDEDLN